MQRLLLAGLCALAALPALALEKKVPNNWAILESSTVVWSQSLLYRANL